MSEKAPGWVTTMSLYPFLYAREVALAEKELAFGGWGQEGSLSDNVTLRSGTSSLGRRDSPPCGSLSTGEEGQ